MKYTTCSTYIQIVVNFCSIFSFTSGYQNKLAFQVSQIIKVVRLLMDFLICSSQLKIDKVMDTVYCFGMHSGANFKASVFKNILHLTIRCGFY